MLSDSGNIAGLIGNYYFITDHLAALPTPLMCGGKLIRKNIYKPFGRLNEQLSYMNSERVDQARALQPKYTGQNYEHAVGLDNKPLVLFVILVLIGYELTKGRFATRHLVFADTSSHPIGGSEQRRLQTFEANALAAGQIPNMSCEAPDYLHIIEWITFQYIVANYKARFYDQETGRFLQTDPVQSENAGYDNYDAYQYVHNNPTNFNDPTGESAIFGPDGVWLGFMITIFLLSPALNTCGKFGPVARFIGPGTCSHPPARKSFYERGQYAIILAVLSNKMDLASLLLLILFNDYYGRSSQGLTEVDKASRIHDWKAGNFTHSSNTQGNNKWIKSTTSLWQGGGLLGPIPTHRM